MAHIDNRIAGALFDFAGYLTTLPKTMPVGATELATPMVEALSAWARERGLELDEADVKGWHDRLPCGCPRNAAMHDLEHCNEFAPKAEVMSEAVMVEVSDDNMRMILDSFCQCRDLVLRTRDEWQGAVHAERAADREVERLQNEIRAMADKLVECGATIRAQEDDLAALTERFDATQRELETERLRLAACGVAALGYFTGCKDEYRSASLLDVLRLYAKCERLRKGVMPDAGSSVDHTVTGAAHRENAGLLVEAPMTHRLGR